MQSFPGATDTSFTCKHCGTDVPLSAPGTQNRNHCPSCLYSRHVDITRGDRRSKCKGMMRPVGAVTRDDGEILLIHQCQGCGFVNKNRIAGDDDDARIAELLVQGKRNRVLIS